MHHEWLTLSLSFTFFIFFKYRLTFLSCTISHRISPLFLIHSSITQVSSFFLLLISGIILDLCSLVMALFMIILDTYHLVWFGVVFLRLGILLLFFRLFIGIVAKCYLFDHYFIGLELARSSLCYCPLSFDYCSSWHHFSIILNLIRFSMTGISFVLMKLI